MIKKFNKNKEWLYENFIVKGRTSYDIADELRITQAGLHFWITKFNLNRKRMPHSQKTKEIREKCINSVTKPEYSTHINQGYKFIKIGNKFIREHHYIWKKYSEWGFIPQGFVVHHINQNKLDNRIENLACIPLVTHVSMHKGGG